MMLLLWDFHTQIKTSLRDYPQACFGDVGDVVNISKIIANGRFIS